MAHRVMNLMSSNVHAIEDRCVAAALVLELRSDAIETA
jgi:hypothetical protein